MRQHSVASQRADSDAATRVAWDGCHYTRAEIMEYYTCNGQKNWNELGQTPTAQHRLWVNSELQLTADRPDADSSAWPTADAYSSASSGSSDCAYMHPQIVLTCAQLETMRIVNGHGVRFAYLRQRELRAELLRLGTYGHDLTHEAWPWRDVIRSLSEGLRTALVGPGVTMFAFKRVRGQRVRGQLAGRGSERHVFHIARADNVAHLLHYHQNGSMVDFVKICQRQVTQMMFADCVCQRHVTNHGYNSALQPVVFDQRIITGPSVCRREAATACITLLEHCAGPRAASVDVTDEVAFPWRRWLLHATNGEEARRGNIVKVFICRPTLGSEPCIACCRADGTYVCIYPHGSPTWLIHDDWPAKVLFHYPYFVTVMWKRIIEQA